MTIQIAPNWHGEVGDAESSKRWACFDRAEVELWCGEMLTGITPEDALQLATDLTGWDEFYSGPGRAFGHAPRVRIAGCHVLVTQWTGLDI
jgi:hypothetical protein